MEDQNTLKRVQFNMHLKQEIKQIHQRSKQRYGSPRIHKELQMQGVKASLPLVAKLMRQENIYSIIRRRFKQTTDSKHRYPIAPNLLMQQFSVNRKNEVWVSDITYVPTAEGWLYLTTVIDLFDRKVIGWAHSKTMYAEATSVAAFKMAALNSSLQNNQSLIFHSDRGIQYACDEFTSELQKRPNISQSMSRKGNCWDNAVAESFFKTLKTELVYHRQYLTRQQAALDIFEYIETFYNTNRRHQLLNNLTIREHESLIFNQLNNAA